MNSNVIVSIGCNRNYEFQMQHIRECLLKTFPDARFSEAVTSPDYGHPEEAPYSNMLVRFSTTLSEEELVNVLKQQEQDLGNTKDLRNQGIVMMDLDILQFNKEKRHQTDWVRPYIQTLMKLLFIFIALFSVCGIFAQNDRAKILLSKAIEYYTGQKYHECILTFKELEKHYRLNPRYTAYLGYSYFKEGQYEDAVMYLEAGIPKLEAYSPFEQASYIYACAESYFNQQKYQDAIPWYSKALPFVNGIDKGDVYYHTGFSHYMNGNNKEAFNNLFKADSIYNDSIYGANLDKQHIARKAQAHTMLKALK